MRVFRPISLLAPAALSLVLSTAAISQIASIPQSAFVPSGATTASSNFALASPTPRLSPELALAAYERGTKEQSSELGGYTATSVIDAELPGSAQKAEFELKRHYAAPSVLEFTPVRSSGDKFVKSNVIVRLLQSEVDRVRRREQAETAITSDNYKFNYKGLAQLVGASVHVYDVKPRQKHVGLFKGKIYVEASTGHLLRAEGRIVRSPSFFIKKVDFVQEYASVEGFTFPTHIHSEAQTRLVGKAIVDISYRDYHTQLAGGSDTQLEVVAFIDGTN